MDPVMGGFVAAVVAWVSVVVAALVPIERWVPVEGLRRTGGLTLGLLAASTLGAPVPPWLAPAVLVGGLLGARLSAPRSP